MDDTTRAALRIALEIAVKDRDRADATIALLSEKLGMGEASVPQVIGPGEMPTGVDAPRDVGPVHVAEGEFYGMSQTQAAHTFLERAGRSRPQKTEQIVAALSRGGIRIGGKNPPTDTIYKILNRDGRFHRPAPNTWGLIVWYPGASKKPAKAAASAVRVPNEDLTPPAAGEGTGDADSAPSEEGGGHRVLGIGRDGLRV